MRVILANYSPEAALMLYQDLVEKGFECHISLNGTPILWVQGLREDGFTFLAHPKSGEAPHYAGVMASKQ